MPRRTHALSFFFAQGRCYGCMSYGNVDLKHPVNADKYEGLYSRPFNLCCGVVPELDVGHDVPTYIQNEDDRLADEEAEIRRIYKVMFISCVVGTY